MRGGGGAARFGPCGAGNGPDHCARQLLNRGRRRGRPSLGSPSEASRSSAPALLVCLLLYVYIYNNQLYRCALSGCPRGVQYSPPKCGVPVCCDVCGPLASWGGITVGQTVACSSDMSTRIFAFCLNARLCHSLFFVTPALNDKGTKMKALCLWLRNKRLGSSFVYKKMARLL